MYCHENRQYKGRLSNMKKILSLSPLFFLFSQKNFALRPEEFCETSKQNTCVTPFGAVLGQYENVVGFSNCRSECIRRFQNKVSAKDAKTNEDIDSGMAWQCVEYVRRWWILERGIKFGFVETADEIFSLTEATRLVDSQKIFLKTYQNGAKVSPAVGDLLIYKKQKNHPSFQYGHVAVVVGVNLNVGYIDVAEQNYDNKKWESPYQYSRRIALEFKNDAYTVYNIPFVLFYAHKEKIKEKEMIMGWVSPDFSMSLPFEKKEILFEKDPSP